MMTEPGCRARRLVLLTVLVLLLTGCGWMKDKLYNDYAPAPLDSHLKNTDGQGTPYQRIVDNAKTWSDPPDPACITGSTALGVDCRATRDYVAAVLVSASNELCTQHLKRAYGNEASYNIAFGTLTNLFSGGAAVIGGVATKSALGALAVFSNAERSLINESVYKTMLVQSIAQKISTTRAEKLKAIDQKLLLPEYTAPRMIMDVLDYHDSCSFMDGLQRALNEGVKDAGPARLAALRASTAMAKTELELRLNQLRTDTDKAQSSSIYCDSRTNSASAATATAVTALAVTTPAAKAAAATTNLCALDAVCNTTCARYVKLADELFKLETQPAP